MREYGGDIHSICLKAETLAKEQFNLKVFFIAP